jgi:hypothetical protein
MNELGIFPLYEKITECISTFAKMEQTVIPLQAHKYRRPSGRRDIG